MPATQCDLMLHWKFYAVIPDKKGHREIMNVEVGNIKFHILAPRKTEDNQIQVLEEIRT